MLNLCNGNWPCRIFVGMVLWIILGSIILTLTGCFDVKLTQEQQWVHSQDQKCRAASGKGSYDKETKIYECWNKPAFRRPKVVFNEKYI
jgi:hypothetical protein